MTATHDQANTKNSERSIPAAEPIADRYRVVRQFTDQLQQPLSPEDCVIQSMPDASPVRWHLAHTTWFFEHFLLGEIPGYRPYHPDFSYLFNSYYNAVGPQFPRSQRGLLSRPSLDEIRDYRRYVDQHVFEYLNERQLSARDRQIVTLGLNHEQQHQELILTDLKHLLSCNPLFPIYREAKSIEEPRHGKEPCRWTAYSEGNYEVGHTGSEFAYDNEMPRHRVFVESFQLASRLVTCDEFREFIEDGGYARPELWLSAGWQQAQDHGWQAPMYWINRDGAWHMFTLSGLRELDLHEPVCHVSYFEANAYAAWKEARLPTEFEWEVAAQHTSITGNFADTLMERQLPIHPRPGGSMSHGPAQMFGDVWEWTASSYEPYPRFEPLHGALGEYNGKFMCGQYVLRGGSCATSQDHVRRTYRNFFPPSARWQFSGIRLAR